MHVLVTAGPTREPIDSVRFITNASSGRMGYAVAAAAEEAGHRVTLLTGPVSLAPPPGVEVARFVTVEDLRDALDARFDACDALVMAAAVGDFAVRNPSPAKIPRAGGPVTIDLVPTEDLLAGLGARRRPGQVLIGFAVEDAADAAGKARAEMARKRTDYTVVNTPAALSAARSLAAILSPAGVVLPWAERSKDDLAREIVRLLARPT